jgi:putative transposase
MMVGYAFHVSNFHTLLSTGFHRRFPNVPLLPPEMITVDNGPEFIGKALDAWAHRHGVKLVFNRPGKPVDNTYIESFNGRLRDECLNVNWFMSLAHAREVIGKWQEDYNSIRPRSGLGRLTPEEFLVQQKDFYQEEVVY